ncbi:MAG: hypothetical protein J6Y82_07180 [Bacteroidales bacterium]|nr:hypothetical protein [Bacteroidales bacterium]
MNNKIIPCVGFDKVKFGMTRDQVIAALGNPNEIEEDQNYGDTPDELTTVFYYDEIGVSLSFDKEEKYRLTEMSFEDERYSLCDTIKVGMMKDAAIAAAEKAGLGEAYEDDLSDDLQEGEMLESYTFEDKNVSLWFEANVLVTIQIGPDWIDDDTIKWPK